MRQSKAAKAQTHAAIVAAAARLFRARGIERTSVTDVMQAAEKTHGGFYRHFATKEALLESALDAAFAEMHAIMAAGLSQVGPAQALAGFAGHYLSDARIADRAGGCPVAALSGEIARGAEGIREQFGQGTARQIDVLAEALVAGGESADAAWNRAACAFAMAAGAVMIARASDRETGERVLAAVRAGVAAR